MTDAPKSPAQLAAYARKSEEKRLLAARAEARRVESVAASQRAMDALNADRVARGLEAIGYSRPRTKFVSAVVPRPTSAHVAPTILRGRLVDHAALADLGIPEASVPVLLQHARHFLCGGWTEGADFSLNVDGLSVRPALWPELGRRTALALETSKVRTTPLRRKHRAELSD